MTKITIEGLRVGAKSQDIFKFEQVQEEPNRLSKFDEGKGLADWQYLQITTEPL